MAVAPPSMQLHLSSGSTVFTPARGEKNKNLRAAVRGRGWFHRIMVFVVGRREWNVFSDDDRRPGSLTDGLDAPLHANVKHYVDQLRLVSYRQLLA